MGKIKKFLLAIGLGLLAIGIVFLISNFTGNDVFKINPENISIFEEEDSVYYLKKAPKDLGFEVFLTESAEDLEYKLTDEAGNDVEAKIKKKKDNIYEIKAPKSGYDEGERYTLELGPESLFFNEDLLHAESLVFSIERSPIEYYKFTDKVIELDEEIVQVTPDTIEIDDYDFKKDDIIFGLNDDEEYTAYKVSEVLNENQAHVTIPAVDEIYSELEVYGEYEFDFNDVLFNPEIEAELISNVKNSNFFSFLLTKAYGAEKDDEEVDISLEYEKDSKNDTLKIKVVITLKAGEEGLFAKKNLKYHEVELTLVSEFGTTANLDIDSVKNWDVSATRSEGFAWEVDITYKPPEKDQSSKFTDLFKKDNEEDIMEITRLLNDMVSDGIKSEIKLFEHSLPVSGVPGLILSLDINIALSLDLQANLNFKNNYSTVTTAGLMYRDSQFKTYYNNNFDGGNGEASIKGELNSKAGTNFKIKTKLLHDKIAYMSLKPEVGLYADAYVVLTMNNLKLDQNKSTGYFESGTYFNALAKGHINTLFKEYDFEGEIDDVKNKFEKLSFGDYKIVGGLETEKQTIFSKDFLARAPHVTFNYYDIRNEKEESKILNASEMSYFLEDEEEVKLKDDKLIIPETDEEELVLRAEYQDDSGQVYSLDLDLYISENREDGLIDHDDFEDPMHLTFSSGIGAWLTEIQLASDGSFTGKYVDANAGQSGNGYLATDYISEFTGWFGDIQRLDEETYSMKLLDINYEHEEDEEWIEEQTKYIATDAYGFEEGEDFFLYSPKKYTLELNEDFLSWARRNKNDADPKEELRHWGLHNLETDYGFYSKQYIDDDPDSESEETAFNPAETLPINFEDIDFDNDYSGSGSEFIGTWHQVNNGTVDFGPYQWDINYKDGTFYIRAELPGDPAFIMMTAEYNDGELHSHNGTQVNVMDYQNPDTLEVGLPETIEVDDEVSRLFFEDGYLQWHSDQRGDLRDTSGPGIEGYEKE